MVLERLEEAIGALADIRADCREYYSPEELRSVMGEAYDALTVLRTLSTKGLNAFKECGVNIDPAIFYGSFTTASTIIRDCLIGQEIADIHLGELSKVFGTARDIKNTIPGRELDQLYHAGLFLDYRRSP